MVRSDLGTERMLWIKVKQITQDSNEKENFLLLIKMNEIFIYFFILCNQF